jgi:ribosome maturation factor RimP
LEVSSPGIDRVWRRDEHFNKYINSKIEVSSFKPIDGNKKIECVLKEFSNNEIVVD